MAVQFTNFLNAPSTAPDLSEVGNLFQNAFQGYKIAKAPEQMERQAQKEQLANALAQLQVQHAPKEMSLRDQLLQEQINKARQPTYAGDPLAKALEMQKAYKGTPQEEQINRYVESIINQNEMKKQNMDTRQAYANAIGWKSLPSAEKNRSLALAAGMGIEPTKAANHFAGGGTLEQLANENGFTLSEINPQYAPTTPNITSMQRRTAFDEEMKTLNEKIKEGLSPYAQKYFGYSFDQVADQLNTLGTGKETDETKRKLGKYLAARALTPEMNALRMNTMGGRVGIEAIRDLESKSMTRSKVIETIDPKVFEYMQDYMTKYIDEALSSYNRVIIRAGKIGAIEPSGGSNQDMDNKVYNLETGQWENG